MLAHNDAMFFGGGFMWLFWIGLIVIIALVVKSLSATGKPGAITGDKSPLEILKERYALGEIDESEYERRREEIES